MNRRMNIGVKEMKVCPLLLLFFLAGAASAQSITVADGESGFPLAQCKVWVDNRSDHWISDSSGFIELSNARKEDLLRFEMVGYATRYIKARNLVHGDTLFLVPTMSKLQAVSISPLTPEQYVLSALNASHQKYKRDSFYTQSYFSESLREDGRLIHSLGAFASIVHPGYYQEQDSFDFRLLAGKHAADHALEFMSKERDKAIDKEFKSARKKDESIERSSIEWPFEIIHPVTFFKVDPLRMKRNGIRINNSNVDFLDSTNFDKYNIWYGTPAVVNGHKVDVIHFEQRPDVKAPMLSGSLMIDPETLAFVRIAFGLSEHAETHLLPAYMKAALWIYGLKFRIEETELSFSYRMHNTQWLLHSATCKGVIYMEKRRFFGENERGQFSYESEINILKIKEDDPEHEALLPYNYKKFLTDQLPGDSDERWPALKSMLVGGH